MVPGQESGSTEPPTGYPTICKSETMRSNIFYYRCLRWTTAGAARVYLPQDVSDDEISVAGRIWKDAEMATQAELALQPGGSDLALVASTPSPATHIINEDRDMDTIRQGGIMKHSDVELGQLEAYKMGVYMMRTEAFIENQEHQKTLRIDDKLWLSPSADPSWTRYSRTNMAPGKTDDDVEEGRKAASEVSAHANAARKIWLLSKCQSATIPYPTWNIFWPLLMKQLSELKNRLSMNANSTLADCLDWNNGIWRNYPDHGGMVNISIPLVGRSRFREKALNDNWREFSHFTPMKCLASILEIGILLPSRGHRVSQDGTLLPTRVASGGREHSPTREPDDDSRPQVHCCQWTDGPDSRLKYATFSEQFNDNNWIAVEVRVVSAPECEGGLCPAMNAEPGSGHYVGRHMEDIVIHSIDFWIGSRSLIHERGYHTFDPRNHLQDPENYENWTINGTKALAEHLEMCYTWIEKTYEKLHMNEMAVDDSEGAGPVEPPHGIAPPKDWIIPRPAPGGRPWSTPMQLLEGLSATLDETLDVYALAQQRYDFPVITWHELLPRTAIIEAHGPQSGMDILTEKAASWHDWTSKLGGDDQKTPRATPWCSAERPPDAVRVRQLPKGSTGAPSRILRPEDNDASELPTGPLRLQYPLLSSNNWFHGGVRGCDPIYEWLTKHNNWRDTGSALDTMALPGYTQREIRECLAPYWPLHDVDITGQAVQTRDLRWVELVAAMFKSSSSSSDWWKWEDEQLVSCVILGDGSIVQAESQEKAKVLDSCGGGLSRPGSYRTMPSIGTMLRT